MDKLAKPSKSSPVALLVVVLALIFFLACQPFFAGRTYSDYDLREQFLPWRAFSSLVLERGELGLWNPFLSRGYPHHAEGQSGILHPVHLLVYRWLPLGLAVALEMTLYFPFALAGMYLLLRRGLRLTRLASVFGGGVFAYSAFFMAHFMHVNMLWVYAHLPWAVGALLGCVYGRRRGFWAAGLGALYASMLHLGWPPQVWMNSLALGAVMVWVGLREGWGADCRRGLLLGVLGIAAGALIGMLQVLPTADLLAMSPRGRMTPELRGNFSLHPLNAIIQFAPFFLIDKCVPDLFYAAAGEGSLLNNLQEFPNYLGISLLTVHCAGLLLFGRALAERKNRSRVLWAALAMLAFVLLTLGRHGGLNEFLRLVPLVSQFRSPARHLSLIVFFHALLAAYIIDRLDRADSLPPLSGRLLAGISLPALAAVVLLAVGCGLHLTSGSGPGYLSFGADRLYLGSYRELLIGPLFGVLSVGLTALYLLRRRRLWLALLAAVCLIDVGAYGLVIPRRSPTRALGEVAAMKARMQTAPHDFRHTASTNTVVWRGHYLAEGYLGIRTPEALSLSPVGDSRLLRHHLRLASVRVAHAKEAQIWLGAAALPRLRLARQLSHAEAPLEAAANVDLAQTVLCRPDVAPEMDGPPLAPSERVEFVQDGADSLRISLRVEHPRVLVLSDRWWPHWEARVDGRERPILPLFDRSIRGVIVHPGESELVMRYRSAPLRRGAAAAAVGLLLLAGLLALELKRKRCPQT